MKVLLKTSIVLCMSILLLCAPIKSKADTAGVPADTTYQDLIATPFFNDYCTVEQPDDAIPLSMVTNINTSMQTDNYSGGYFNLPRLRAGYYYRMKEGDASGFTVPNTVYPCLRAASKIELNTKGMLEVWELNGSKAVTSFSIIAAETLPAATETSDCSSGFDTNLFKVLTDGAARKYFDSDTTVYNHSLHKYGIVTKKHILLAGTPDNIWLNTELKIEGGALAPVSSGSIFDEAAYAGTLPIFKQTYPYYINDIDYSEESGWNFKDILSHDLTDPANGLVLYYNGYDKMTGSLSAGFVKETNLTSMATLIVATDAALYAYSTEGATAVSKTTLPKAESSNIKVQVTYNKEIDLRYLQDGSTRLPYMNPFLSLKDGSTSKNYKIRPLVSWNGDAYVSSILPGGAYHPSASALVYESSGETFTIKFDAAGGSAVAPITSALNAKPAANALPVPNREYYTFSGWYTDIALNTAYTPSAIQVQPGGEITLYAKWVYSGGSYTAVFLDRKRETSTSVELPGNTLPVFPAIENYQGFCFKSWEVISSPDVSTGTGVPYDPENFKPVPGGTYYFNALYATSGVIKSVNNTKSTYYVGDAIEKGHLTVTVQTDDAGTTRTLSSSEFTVSPGGFDVKGPNTFQVTFTATGATAAITLTAIEDSVQSISAAYIGDSLTVGTDISKENITLTRKYRSGKTDKTNDFTFTPSTVYAVGSNTIRVQSGGFTTSVIINGKRITSSSDDESNRPNVNNRVSSITANYSGEQLYVGDAIKGSDIKASATYLDGSTTVLDSSMFSYTPSYARRAGKNTVTIVYSGKSTSITIDVLEKSGISNTDKAKPNREEGTAVNNGNDTGVTGDDSDTVREGNASAMDKKTSTGYLGGSNVLSNGVSMSGASQNGVTFVNDVDILDSVNSASSKASSVSIDLINHAVGNTITTDVIEVIKTKKLLLIVNMMDGDTGKKIATWNMDGETLSLIKNSKYVEFSPNITMSEIEKPGEKLIAVRTDTNKEAYNYISSLSLSLEKMYEPGSTIHVYATDASGGASTYVDDILIGNSSVIDVPLSSAPYYIFTDLSETYPDNSNLITDILVPEMDEEKKTQEEPPVEPSVPIQVEPSVSKPKSGIPLLILLIPLIIVIGVVIAAIIYTRIQKGMAATFDNDLDEEEDAEPAYDYDDTGDSDSF